ESGGRKATPVLWILTPRPAAEEAQLRSTIVDIAREAGVSTATVDRVLNNRIGARSRTRDIVLETAMRLGYIPDGKPAAASPAVDPGDVVRLDFVLPQGN